MTKVNTEFSRAEYDYHVSSLFAIILYNLFKGRNINFSKWGLTLAKWCVYEDDYYSTHFIIKYKSRWAYREDIKVFNSEWYEKFKKDNSLNEDNSQT